MGIPAFYKWLKARYPLITKNFTDTSRPVIDNFYIDFNQMVFSSIKFFKSMFLEEYNSKFPTQVPSDKEINMGLAEKKKEITQEILRYLDEIVQLVRPSSLLFIAIDGTPPYNKIYNQVKDHQYEPDKEKEHTESDIDVISGSHYMVEFQRDLQEFIKAKTKDDAAWKNPQVIYSSVNNPGETEHKIFEFIKNRSKNSGNSRIDANEVHCIYSNDADIIPLILLTEENNFMLMRKVTDDDDHIYFLTESDFELVYVNILREYLIYEVESDESLDKIKPKNIFTDWVFLLSLVGNDFFNGFKYFHNSKKGFVSSLFVTLMYLYEKNIFKKNLSLITADNEIDCANFYKLMKVFMESVNQKIDEKVYNDQVSLECEKLLNNLNWLLKYYIGECVSWSYFYSYDKNLRTIPANETFYSQRYPLSFSDLCIFIDRKVLNAKTPGEKYYICPFAKNEPLTPFEALTARYPSWRNLLPKALRDVIDEYQEKNRPKNKKSDTNNKNENDQDENDQNKKKNSKKTENNVKEAVYKLISYNEAKNLVRKASVNFTSEDYERNRSHDEFIIIEGEHPKAGIFNLLQPEKKKDVWIPSLNKLSGFFKYQIFDKSVIMKNEETDKNNKLSPDQDLNENKMIPQYQQPDEKSLKELNDNLAGKIILVDYPFLKPVLVQRIKFEKYNKIPKIEGIEIRVKESESNKYKENVLTVIGYPLIISATDHSSISFYSETEKYPFALTMPLYSQLNVVISNLKSKTSAIQIHHKAIIPEEKLFGRIEVADTEGGQIYIKEITTNEPDLSDFFENEITLNQKGPLTIISKDDMRKMEDILENFKLIKNRQDEMTPYSIDDVIWEGKPLNIEQTVEIGDRAISIMHGGPVKFGTAGTVVGYNSRYDEVTVVFDQVQKYGVNIYGYLRTFRGLIGKKYDFFLIRKYKLKANVVKLADNEEINISKITGIIEKRKREIKDREKREKKEEEQKRKAKQIQMKREMYSKKKKEKQDQQNKDDDSNDGNAKDDNSNNGNTKDDDSNNENIKDDNSNNGNIKDDNSNNGNTKDDNSNNENTNDL